MVRHIYIRVLLTSYRPPEQAKESGVSLVLSDWASMSAPWSNSISTTSAWPAVAARISGVNPAHRDKRHSGWGGHFGVDRTDILKI